ncbi:hypothetical protein V8E53_014617, partial [Lactarius tabidus]
KLDVQTGTRVICQAHSVVSCSAQVVDVVRSPDRQLSQSDECNFGSDGWHFVKTTLCTVGTASLLGIALSFLLQYCPRLAY